MNTIKIQNIIQNTPPISQDPTLLCDCCFYICVEEYIEKNICNINNHIINFDYENITFIDPQKYDLIISGNCLILSIINAKNNRCYGCEHPYIPTEDLEKCIKQIPNINIDLEASQFNIDINNNITIETNNQINFDGTNRF